jgi:hypothetical protein
VTYRKRFQPKPKPKHRTKSSCRPLCVLRLERKAGQYRQEGCFGEERRKTTSTRARSVLTKDVKKYGRDGKVKDGK